MKTDLGVKPLKTTLSFQKLVVFSFLVLICGTSILTAQNDENYIVIGRAVDANSRPVSNACVNLIPEIPVSWEEFILCSVTDSQGRFSIVKNRKSIRPGVKEFLYISLYEITSAMNTLEPPFDWIRTYDRAFQGREVKFGSKYKIDLGDVPVRFYYNQINLDLAEYIKESSNRTIDWRSLFIRIRNKDGYGVFEGSLSLSGVEKYVDRAHSMIRLLLPDGKWKFEILFDGDDTKIFGESNYFTIKRGEKTKRIGIRPFPTPITRLFEYRETVRR